MKSYCRGSGSTNNGQYGAAGSAARSSEYPVWEAREVRDPGRKACRMYTKAMYPPLSVQVAVIRSCGVCGNRRPATSRQDSLFRPRSRQAWLAQSVERETLKEFPSQGCGFDPHVRLSENISFAICVYSSVCGPGISLQSRVVAS